MTATLESTDLHTMTYDELLQAIDDLIELADIEELSTATNF
jgi:hypothetical protein